MKHPSMLSRRLMPAAKRMGSAPRAAAAIDRTRAVNSPATLAPTTIADVILRV